MSTAVIILGTYRSGIGGLAGVLDKLDVDMNGTPSQANPYNEQLLKDGNTQAFFSQRDFTKPFIGVKSFSVTTNQDKFSSFVTTLKTKATRVFVIKLTRSAQDCWSDYQTAGKTILKSLQEMEVQKGIIDGIFNAYDNSDKLDINYNTLISNPQQEVQRICTALGLTYNSNSHSHVNSSMER